MVRYPVGQQDFKGIREDGCVYIDKTDFITRLINEGKYYFLARPRRFGKSLFLSTLKYFFLGERNLFEGLKIASSPWDWESYPVIHIDLNGVDYTTDENSLIVKLTQQLQNVEEKYEVSVNYTDIALRFEALILQLHKLTGKPVVILVDEYEKPVLDTIDNPALSGRYLEILRGFYSILKSLDNSLKFVFLTGITKFGKMSVFSALNNIRDISFDNAYSSICGITEDELISNFQEGILDLAQVEETEFKGALKLLKLNYDGYHFSDECPDIYNPYSLLTAFVSRKIGSYWSKTGTPTILAKLLLEKHYDLENLNGVRATQDDLMDIGNLIDNPVALFYQTGYLTIKNYNKLLKAYTLGFPNREVEVAFCKFITPYYLNAHSKGVESYILDFAEGILTGDPYLAMKALESFSSSINYEIAPTPEVERHFQLMIYMFSRLILPYASTVKTEERTSDGRIDLLITTTEYVYIFEFKRDSSPAIAIKQIEEKEYWKPYITSRKKIFLIGINFSTPEKRIDGYLIKEI